MASSDGMSRDDNSGHLRNESVNPLLYRTADFERDFPNNSSHYTAQSELSNAPHSDHSDRSGLSGVARNLLAQDTSGRGRAQYTSIPSIELDEQLAPNKSPALTSQASYNGLRNSFWTPYTLRWPFLTLVLIISLLLTLTVILLTVYSSVQHGLGADDGSSAILFGWRFTPTLITVLFAVLTLMIYNDSQRTEPYAQMSHIAGAVASSSICRRNVSWWTAIGRSMKRSENHGYINYFILSTALVNAINTILINTLSSSLLQSQNVELQSQATFTRYVTTAQEPITMAANDLVYFQTISNIVQNLTTSPWLTEKYAVVPFRPSSDESDQNSLVSGNTEQWNATTTVLSMELICEPMIVHYANWSKNFTGDDGGERPFDAFLLTDSQGCEVGLNFYRQMIASYTGGSWFNPPNFTVPVWDSSIDDPGPWDTYYNSTSQCADREVIFATNFTVVTTDSTSRAWSCRNDLYTADMYVTASTTSNGMTIDVDDAVFNASRNLATKDSILDETRFQDAFLNQNWSSTLYTASQFAPAFGGPSTLLAAIYNSNTNNIVTNDTVINNAQRLKQRFLGEMVQNTVSNNAQTSQNGQIFTVQPRVIVNIPVGIALAILFFVSTLLIAITLFTSLKRSLNLHSDPGSVAASMRLIDGNPTIYGGLKAQDQDGTSKASSAFQETKHSLVDGKILSQDFNAQSKEAEPSSTSSNKKRADWRPFVIRRSAVLLLALFLALVFAATLALYIVAQTSGLYESAFTYQAVFLQSNDGFFEFVPFSIVPTFIAVVVGLWWTSLDDTFKRLQPFSAMTQRAVPITPMVGVSYALTTPAESMVKATTNKHWLIVLVSTAALLTQVLTVSMSALWQRTDGSRAGTLNLVRTFEPRALPFVYEFAVGTSNAGSNAPGQAAMVDLYANLSTNWLYSATLQLAYNGTQPGWSSDGWSFVPVDLSSIVDSKIYTSTPSTASVTGNKSATVKDVNVTLITPALRGTVDCVPVQSTTNLSSWSTKWDLRNASVWNVTENPTDWQTGVELNTMIELDETAKFATVPILSRPQAPTCCSNLSNTGAGSAAIGYWSNNYNSPLLYDFITDSGPYPRNFTMKWIVGDADPRLYLINETYSQYYLGGYQDYEHFIWPTQPQMTALNCRPRVEWTNASVTVDMATLKVQKYSIVDPVETFDWPWKDVYAEHNYTMPGVDQDLAVPEQMSVSFGVLFQDAMMVAADLNSLWPGSGSSQTWSENIEDKSFNFRLPETGLNNDLMSYCMYQLAGGDLQTLTDPEKMSQLGEKVFSTFFQHFVSYNVSATGGWAMQKIGATLPANLGAMLDTNTTAPDQNVTFTSDTQASAQIEIAVEVLQMSPTAVYISLAILLIQIAVIAFAFFTGLLQMGKLRHDFDDLASVFGVVYASERLRQWVRSHPEPEQWKHKQDSREMPYIRLGSFTALQGQQTWGIEIVEGSNGGLDDVRGGNKSGPGVHVAPSDGSSQ